MATSRLVLVLLAVGLAAACDHGKDTVGASIASPGAPVPNVPTQGTSGAQATSGTQSTSSAQGSTGGPQQPSSGVSPSDSYDNGPGKTSSGSDSTLPSGSAGGVKGTLGVQGGVALGTKVSNIGSGMATTDAGPKPITLPKALQK